MSGTDIDRERAARVEEAVKGALVGLVQKFHLAGWVDDRSLSVPQLWRTVEIAMEDERSGVYRSMIDRNNASLVLYSLEILKGHFPSGDASFLGVARLDIDKFSQRLIEEVEEVTRSDARPRTRYHEPWPFFFLYALPVAFVYLEWHGLPVVLGGVILGASFVVAIANFLVRYYSRSWFYERLGGGGFRAYPGP